MNDLPEPQNEFEGAQKVLQDYYRRLVQDMAEQIIREADRFEEGAQFSAAGDLIERMGCELGRLSTVYQHISRFAAYRRKTDSRGDKRAFPCLVCGGKIEEKETACRVCGWTWL